MNDLFDVDGIFHFGSDTSKRNFGDLPEDYHESQFDKEDFNFRNKAQNFDPLLSLMEDFMSTFSQDFGMFPAFPGMNHRNVYDQKRPPRQSLRDQLLKKPEEEPLSAPEKDPGHSRKNQKNFTNDNIDSMFESFFGRSFVQPFVGVDLPKEDTDLDSDVRQQGLDTTLKRDDSSREERSLFSPFRNHSLFSSESRSVIRRSDGSTEQRITRRSSDGTDEVTIISETPSGERRTEIRHGDGSVEVVEDETTRTMTDDHFDLTPRTSHYADTMYSSINSFFNYFFGK